MRRTEIEIGKFRLRARSAAVAVPNTNNLITGRGGQFVDRPHGRAAAARTATLFRIGKKNDKEGRTGGGAGGVWVENVDAVRVRGRSIRECSGEHRDNRKTSLHFDSAQ